MRSLPAVSSAKRASEYACQVTLRVRRPGEFTGRAQRFGGPLRGQLHATEQRGYVLRVGRELDPASGLRACAQTAHVQLVRRRFQGLECERDIGAAPREIRPQRTQAMVRITQLVDGHRELAIRGQQRARHGEHRRCTLQVEPLELQSSLGIGPAPQFPGHVLHFESCGGDAVLHEAVDCEAAPFDGEVMNAIGVDPHLRAHGKRARTDFGERFGQTALDARKVARERDLPGLAAIIVHGTLDAARPGKLTTDAARRFRLS